MSFGVVIDHQRATEGCESFGVRQMVVCKSMSLFTCIGGFLLGTATGKAEPVLLATVSNQTVAYGDAVVEAWLAGDVFRYSAVDANGQFFQVRLFEAIQREVTLGDPPLTVTDSLTWGDDPDFPLVAHFLTDGLSYAENLFQDVAVLRNLGGEDMFTIHVPRFSEYDLFGYSIDRIDRHLTFAMESPGRDLNGDGQWTDFYVGGAYEIWGSPIPEPATVILLGLCASVILRRRSRRDLFQSGATPRP
jgi:hypothetical protein